MAEIYIDIPTLHKGQLAAIEKQRRFNIYVCGRRFGKTVYIRELCLAILDRKRVGVFVHELKDVSETWEAIELICRRINLSIKGYFNIDASACTVHLTYGNMTPADAPCVEVWSLANERKKSSGRGRKYDVVIYEEAQKIPSTILEHHYENVVRATLADSKGVLHVFGTPPPSRLHYLYQMALKGAHDITDDDYDIVLGEVKPSKDYMFFRMPTNANPHIDKGELEAIKSELPEIIYLREYEARFVEHSEALFCLSLASAEVQKRTFGQTQYRRGVETWLSFDFNKNPMAATLWQKHNEGLQIACVAEFGAKNSVNITIYDTLEMIKDYFRLNGRPEILFVTGDATGNTTDPRMRKGLTFFEIILEELDLGLRDLRIRKSNPLHVDSYGQVNNYLALHRSFTIDETNCKRLRNDCLTTRSTAELGIDKKYHDPHFFDTMRYFMYNALPAKMPMEWFIKAVKPQK